MMRPEEVAEIHYRRERDMKVANRPTWELVVSIFAGMALFFIFMFLAFFIVEQATTLLSRVTLFY